MRRILLMGLLLVRSTGRIHASEVVRGYHAEALAPTSVLAAPVSVYVAFARCPRCAYLSFLGGWRPGASRVSIRGRFHHMAYEAMMAWEYELASRFSPVVSDGEMLRELERALSAVKQGLRGRFTAEFRAVGGDYDEEWSLLEGNLRGACLTWLSRLKRFAHTRGLSGAELARAFVPYRRFEVSLSARALGISGGTIDVLEEGVPLEIKTGTPPKSGASPYHELQLTYYALLLEYNTGMDVDFGEIYYTRSGMRVRVIIDRVKRLAALAIRNKALEVFGMKTPPDGLCKLCHGEARYAHNA